VAENNSKLNRSVRLTSDRPHGHWPGGVEAAGARASRY
jgi:hypothetical protein